MLEIQGLGQCVPDAVDECTPLIAVLALLNGEDPPGGRGESALCILNPLGFCCVLPLADDGVLVDFPKLLVRRLKEPSR